MNQRPVCFYHFYSVLFLLAFLCGWAGAAYFENEPMTFKQPDGSEVPVRVWGDEFYQHVETPDGYTLVRNRETGWICYAELQADGMDLIPTEQVYRVGGQKLKTMGAFTTDVRPPKGIRLSRIAIDEQVAQRRRQLLEEPVDPVEESGIAYTTMASRGRGGTTTPGVAQDPWKRLTDAKEKIVGLTILIQFPDVKGTISQQEVVDYCNKPGYKLNGNNGSVFNYFHDVSNGHLEYTNYVTTYYTAKKNKSYYTNEETRKAKELILEALNDLKAQGFDFSRLSTNSNKYVLATNVFYAGKIDNAWGKGLWPHKGGIGGNAFSANGVRVNTYQMTNLGSKLTLGTFCHENGHMIGYWPDLYDYDGGSRGVGGYCIMAGSGGTNPMPPNPYFRNTRGWETIVDITDAAPGETFVHQANSFTTYRYSHPTRSQEFFLIESRLKKGRNGRCPDEGLIIWHVDTVGNNSREEMTPLQHYRVSVMQADGFFQLENASSGGSGGDLFHAGYRDRFNDRTKPDAKWWDGGESGLALRDIGPVGAEMSFTIGEGPAALAYWPLEGDVLDVTGNEWHADVHGLERGGELKWVSSDWALQRPTSEQALCLGANSTFLAVDGAVGAGPALTVACWVKPSELQETVLFDKMPSAGAGWRVLLHSDGHLSLQVGQNDRLETLITSAPVYIGGQWTHVACSFDQGQTQLFVDGMLVSSRGTVTQMLDAGETTLLIGKGISDMPAFVGCLDDIFLFDTAYQAAWLRTLPGLARKRDRLVAYWALDEKTGDEAKDQSPGAHHGSLEKGLAFSDDRTGGVFSGALAFDGKDDYVRISGVDPLEREATLSAWVYPEGMQNDWAGLVFSRSSGTTAGLNVRSQGASSGRGRGRTGGGMSLGYHWAGQHYNVASGLSLAPDEWSFTALSVTPSAATLYLHNGVDLLSFRNQAAHKAQTFRGTIYLGRDPDSKDRHFNGNLDDVRFFNHALSAEQIEAIYLGGAAWGPTPAHLDWIVSPSTELQWEAGENAIAHDVYLGTSALAVEQAGPNAPEYLGRFEATRVQTDLALNQEYYWRVDEVVDENILLTGQVWAFATQGGILRQAWKGIDGTEVDDLVNHGDYAGPPDQVDILQQFETPSSLGDKYGARIMGYLVPQASGPVTFWIAANERAQLWLSPSENPQAAEQIASVDTKSNYRAWDARSSQKSAPQNLDAGQRYFIMALHKEGTGSDHLSVAWRGPDSPTRAVIPGEYLWPAAENLVIVTRSRGRR